ncbi:MAG: hypothetical protein DME34_09330 [Verrucomicrobia bacterium]|nr:MAG: hypothetical protein DME34_09330 [Verrucomicrobiota bacterium]
MRRHVCYIHIGPHKTGTSSIQWWLQQNRTQLLEHGYFVPESATAHGAHHTLGRKLCGQTLPEPQQSSAVEFAQDLARTPCEAVVISSETLEGLLRHAACAGTFFDHIAELNLTPKLVLFPRNQSQSLNSRYAEAVRSFCLSKPFDIFAREVVQRPTLRYWPLLELADAHSAELIARPFTGEIVARGVVGEFLRAIGLDLSQFQNTDVRRNPSVGPFTVSVARHVASTIEATGKQLKWRQAMRYKAELATYLQQNRLADTGYCGLSTDVAREIEAAYRQENNDFAQRVWDATWTEIFAADFQQQFAPNDFDMRAPDASAQRQLERAVRDLVALADEIMRDPRLAVDAPWNDLAQRAGWVAQAPKETDVSR